MGSRSPSPTLLSSNFNQLALGGPANLLQDEDISFAGGTSFSQDPSYDDSFGPADGAGAAHLASSTSSSVGAPPPVGGNEYSYGGSMGTLPTGDPLASSLGRAPSRQASTSASDPTTTATPQARSRADSTPSSPLSSRDLALKEERDALRQMNDLLEGVLTNLQLAEGKMDEFEKTVGTSHKLLDLYVRLSSQAEWTTELLLDGNWEGSTRVQQEDASEARPHEVEASLPPLLRPSPPAQQHRLEAL
ncbi:DASH complex, subunit Duo1 [Pseudohyphozyma bogoriensis]|nr:DASH complex, subunit Duo1 [Pseudohyphozyma bogoriensis]